MVETPESSIKAISKDNVHLICSAQVILSPAIALKEILENSLDAGASNVEVKIVNQGSKSISVSDNGCGVKEVDFQSLTAKHHTSKLNDFSDLDSVSTFGFRGEALSSLCAVGKLTIVTRHKLAPLATRLEFDPNGIIISKKKESRAIGTTVTFEDIFRNLPVRQKELQRNLKKEYAKLISILQSYCLGAQNVRINAVSNKSGKNESILSIAEKGSLLDKIIEIFGQKQGESVVDIEKVKVGDFALSGFISTCQLSQGRSKPDRQFFFVNNRPCELPKGSKAINEIFHQFNRYQYPFCVILITSDIQGNVDVNLTPDKRQIFIERESVIWDALKNKLKEIFDKIAPPDASAGVLSENAKLTNYFTLTNTSLDNSVTDSPKNNESDKKSPISSSEPPKKKSFSRDDFKAKLLSLKSQNPSSGAKKEFIEDDFESDNFRPFVAKSVITESKSANTSCLISSAKKPKIQRIVYDTKEDKIKNNISVLFSISKVLKKKKEESERFDKARDLKGRQFLTSLTDSNETTEAEFKRHLSKNDFLECKVIGQFNLGFIIVRLLRDDLFIVDQHATDEKFRFEQFLDKTKAISQPLVCAQPLELDPGKKEVLLDNIVDLEKLGFGFDTTGSKVRLTKVPQYDRLVLSKDDLDEALFLLSEDGRLELSTFQFSRVRALYASRSCRTAVMIGTALNSSQMIKIIHHMADMNQPWNCPHGRPTLRHLINLQMISSEGV